MHRQKKTSQLLFLFGLSVSVLNAQEADHAVEPLLVQHLQQGPIAAESYNGFFSSECHRYQRHAIGNNGTRMPAIFGATHFPSFIMGGRGSELSPLPSSKNGV